ncbi:Asp23/Gls24 family envelope stress response protein [Actinomadura namibiensis]|uniref:Putative alkaline shock family protein YloU n=1 Tax=Actinomadura namibiensis TaxID=182080 RepID=A0A7W3LXY1_ACTNM|nr:Asp23/Gls24 family envelope stress response protein [Actinomadura namibiensis]MBA8956316.1 putative alkaline shock family protein YloU [Actinomadura namibiensis]
MSDLDSSYSGGAGPDPRPEVRSMPYLPGPPSGPSAPPGPGAPTGATGPLAAPTVAPPREPAQSAQYAPKRDYSEPVPGGSRDPQAAQGRIVIEDAVVERIATLAALEVSGVAGLGGEGPPAGEAPGGVPGGPSARPPVRAMIRDDEITVDLRVAVEYGSVIMEVARVVRGNVARVLGLMLGMRVAAVNVTVEDVRMPAADRG